MPSTLNRIEIRIMLGPGIMNDTGARRIAVRSSCYDHQAEF